MDAPQNPSSHIPKIVPFREGLFAEDPRLAYLIGNRCRECGQTFFPSKPFCFSCFCKAMETVHIGARGTLYSFTTCHLPSGRFKPPYTVGWIDLPEGIRIFAPVKLRKDQALKIGMPMDLVIDRLWRDGNIAILGYKYRPARGKLAKG
jgi:uncharacterized OB-fold protein